jgi:glutamate/tyrosine decarboxylase-like PLP-dependent enzyme
MDKKGLSKDDVLAQLEGMRKKDADWKGGRTFSLVYDAGEDIQDLLKKASLTFFSENALNPIAFPSLRKMERDVIKMTASMLNAPSDAAGSMTSGGSESLLMAVKTAREWAKHVEKPQMLLPISAHPGLEKAAHYFGVEPIRVPLRSDFRADAHAARELITDRTILVVGSAPAYPHGVIDPIEDLAALAKERGILCHVDACLGGFMLPWVQRPLPKWDFRVEGVTSISADIHKYGYAAKGASTIVYRSRALRRHQFFVTTDWPGGLYGSPTMTGTRPAGPIAAAWAVMKHLGEEGYVRLARIVMETTDVIRRGIAVTPGLRILGEPDMSVLAFGSDTLDIHAIGSAMDQRGWKIDAQQRPNALHVMVTPAHARVADRFIADLRECAAQTNGPGEGMAAMYGMLASIPDRSLVKEAILNFMDGLDFAD